MLIVYRLRNKRCSQKLRVSGQLAGIVSLKSICSPALPAILLLRIGAMANALDPYYVQPFMHSMNQFVQS